ncbi:ABC transporter ATP-binding protein [Alkalihalobacillus sp. FSL W8-0930]
MKPIILSNVKKSIENRQVLNIQAMGLEPGSINALVGNNGSGKTTLLNVLTGLVNVDSGNVNRFKETTWEEEWKQKLAFIPQELGPHSYFSLKELAYLEQIAYTGWDHVLFNRLVTEFDLPLKKKLDKLSVGMRKKAMTALALSRPSKLLVMDEPLAGVDISGQEQLKREWISYLEADEERTILFSTHTPSEIGEMADYIHVLKKGELEGPFEKDTLSEQYAYIWVEHAPGLSSIPGVKRVQTTGNTSMLLTEDRFATEEALAVARYEVQQVQALNITDILRAKLEGNEGVSV